MGELYLTLQDFDRDTFEKKKIIATLLKIFVIIKSEEVFENIIN